MKSFERCFWRSALEACFEGVELQGKVRHRKPRKIHQFLREDSIMANFALQLDAFEARLKGRSPKTTLKAFHPAPPDISVANKIVAAMKERPESG